MLKRVMSHRHDPIVGLRGDFHYALVSLLQRKARVRERLLQLSQGAGKTSGGLDTHA